MNRSAPWDEKIVDLSRLGERLAELRAAGKRIVFTNGCFDVLHAGHVQTIAAASQFGDVLVVGLNSDSSVRAIKGGGRPINSQRARAIVLAALQAVDYVVLFDETSVEPLVRAVRPDVLVKGGDYQRSEVVGGDFVESYGGTVVLIPPVPDLSTSAILEALRATEEPNGERPV